MFMLGSFKDVLKLKFIKWYFIAERDHNLALYFFSLVSASIFWQVIINEQGVGLIYDDLVNLFWKLKYTDWLGIRAEFLVYQLYSFTGTGKNRSFFRFSLLRFWKLSFCSGFREENNETEVELFSFLSKRTFSRATSTSWAEHSAAYEWKWRVRRLLYDNSNFPSFVIYYFLFF